MPFIGQQPVTGAYHKLDSITTSATATYNLQLNGGAYSPASANHLLVSLNGVIQAPQDSFTVSGSQITFASALTSSDNIDFIMAFGDVLNIGTPSDGSVNTSQLANSAVTTAKILDGNITDAKMASTLDLSGKTVTYGLTDSDMPAGSVVQVVQTTSTGSHSSGGSTGWFNASSYNVTITPSSASNKVMVFYSIWGIVYDNAKHLAWDLLRNVGGTDSSQFSGVGYGFNSYYTHTFGEFQGPCIMQYLDSPNTTSAITYKPMFNNVNTASNFSIGNGSRRGVTIAMEIKG